MSVALAPTPFQEGVIERFVNANTRGGILGLGTGVGKSLVGVEIAKRRGARRVVIMAPESTFDGWANTVYWQTGIRLRRAANNAMTFTFHADPARRDPASNDYLAETVKLSAARCKANLEACQAGEDGWFFVTRELFTSQTWTKVPVKIKGEQVIDPKTRKPKTRAQRKDIWGMKKPFDIAILDENQRFATKNNRGQQSWRSLQADFKIASSADWFSSKLENMHTVATDIFGDEEIGMNQNTFIDEYLTTEYNHFAWNKKKVIGEQVPGFFAASLPLYVTAPPSVIPPDPERRYLSMSREEMELYRKLETDYVAQIGDEILALETPLTLRIRLRELSLGMFNVRKTGEFSEDGFEKTTIEYPPGAKSTKLDEIRSIISDHPDDHLLILTHSAKWARWAANELGGEAWTGEASKPERAAMKDRFLRGDSKVIVGVFEAMAVGVDSLQKVCHRVVIASRSDQALMLAQGIARVARTGQEREVEVIELACRDTYDLGVIHSIDEKVATLDAGKGW